MQNIWDLWALYVYVSVHAHTWYAWKKMQVTCRIAVKAEAKEPDSFMLRVRSGTVTQEVSAVLEAFPPPQRENAPHGG